MKKALSQSAKWKAHVKKRDANIKRIAKITKPKRMFAIKLSNMMFEAGRLGLFSTQQKISVAVKRVGWEIAEQVEIK